jgi:hypothetical protein
VLLSIFSMLQELLTRNCILRVGVVLVGIYLMFRYTILPVVCLLCIDVGVCLLDLGLDVFAGF